MRRTDLGYALSGLVGLGITVVGTRFLVSPAKAAAAYGISVGQEVSGADPYLSVKGVRDVASGLMTFVLIAAREPRVLAGFLVAATVIPVGDAVIVLRRGGRKSTAYGVHVPTAAAMVATAAILLG
ncbi:MAG TPA: DUF4267 domain-containing protein [Streptosporangiaceae bacterium]|nr:DUF4267 domain-containing protein [Streptosporangiaceae bacterium]